MRAERLRRTKDIELVRSHGEVRSDRHFTLRARANDQGVVRIAVASPRSIGGAVMRNRARRRVREALRSILGERRSASGTDILVLTRAAALEAAFPALRTALERHLGDVLGPS
jgi:ribonuclease P protein component